MAKSVKQLKEERQAAHKKNTELQIETQKTIGEVRTRSTELILRQGGRRRG